MHETSELDLTIMGLTAEMIRVFPVSSSSLTETGFGESHRKFLFKLLYFKIETSKNKKYIRKDLKTIISNEAYFHSTGRIMNALFSSFCQI